MGTAASGMGLGLGSGMGARLPWRVNTAPSAQSTALAIQDPQLAQRSIPTDGVGLKPEPAGRVTSRLQEHGQESTDPEGH